MLEDVLLADISRVHSIGNGNYMFKTNTRTYCLSTDKKFLMRFIQSKGSFSMSEEWFDIQIVLNDLQYSQLKEKLCI